VVRQYSSADKPEPIDPMLEIPTYWVRPPQVLSAGAGMHRFLWDMHYPPLSGIKPEYPISAVPHNTAPQPTSPWVLPGQYTVVLTANGKTYSQPLVVQMDPRVKTSAADLKQQLALSQQVYNDLAKVAPAAEQVDAARKQLDGLKKSASSADMSAAINVLNQKLQAVGGTAARASEPDECSH